MLERLGIHSVSWYSNPQGVSFGGGYKYGWWINSYQGQSTAFAWGANEQYIFVTPSLRLVAVFTSTFNDRHAARPPFLYSEYIVNPALGGSEQ